jgi:GT2 family glycosyltransferase
MVLTSNHKIKPLVSIITLNFNGLKDTIKCINSIKNTQTINYELITIDNGSEKDESKQLIKKYSNFVKVFRLPKNLGFTGGNNWALKKTRGKYIVLLNNDTEVTPTWLEPLVRLMETNKKIAVVQPKIKMLQNKEYFDYAGAAGGFIDKYGFPFTRGRIFNTQEKDRGQYDGEYPIFWASGSACIIRKSIIKKVGGLFSENLFNYMEEIDFCWRVWRAGYKVLFTSNSVIYHKGAASSGKNIVQKRFWEHRNNLYILIRNLDRKSLLKILPARLLLELTAYSYYIISRQQVFLKSLFKAHIDLLKNGFYLRLNRNRKLNHSKIPIYPRSIIFDHYILKKKNFSSLNWSSKGTVNYLIYSTKNNTGNFVIFNQVNKLLEQDYSVSVYTLGNGKQNWFELYVKIHNFIKSYFQPKPDIIVSTFWPTAYIALFMKAEKKISFSQDWGEDLHNFCLFKMAAKYSYKLPGEKIVISKYLANKIKEINPKTNINIIKNSVIDNNIFKPNKKSKTKNSPIRILSIISWYTNAKGPDVLAKVATKLKKMHSNYKFILISRENKPYSEVFDEFYSNPSKITIKKLYHKADFLLSTSRSEGLYLPGLEAMACGIPFITTNSGGVKDYAINYYNAVILKRPEDLVRMNLIDKLIKRPGKISKIIKNGYKTASRYQIGNITEELENILFKQT